MARSYAARARLAPAVKVVMTLLVRNEADVIEASLRFHLNAGVDLIIATDNCSDDGTTDILETWARDGSVHLIRDEDRHLSQIEGATRMARLAATDFGADWVINSDGDEFWWPRGGTLKDVLAAIPSRYGSVRGMWRHFVPRPDDERFFAERMVVRRCVPVTHRQHAFGPHFKTAHRATPDVRVGGGNHDVTGEGLLPLYGWYPIDVLHFPIRSFAQCTQKYVQHYEWRRGQAMDAFMTSAYDAYRQGRMREFYDAEVVDDAQLEQGIQGGTLAIDTRLRDAFRMLDSGARLTFADPDVDESYLSELGTLEESAPLVRAQGRLDELESRLATLERGLPSRLARKLRPLSS
jgi:Glycosyl transferase family 2